MSLAEIGRKAQRINVNQIALEKAKANSGLISDLIKEQLSVGKNAEAQNVGRYTSRRYSDFKRSRGSKAPYGVPDLFVSGNLYSKMKTEVSVNEIKMGSEAEYSKYQEERYGEEIYNLQEQNWEKVQLKVLEDTRKEYLKQLGL